MFLTSIVYILEFICRPLLDSVEVTAPDGILLTLVPFAVPNSGDLHKLMSSILGNK